jgi:carbamoyltransferase
VIGEVARAVELARFLIGERSRRRAKPLTRAQHGYPQLAPAAAAVYAEASDEPLRLNDHHYAVVVGINRYPGPGVNILGINCFSHDTSAALLQDGRPVAVAEQERFNRERHTTAFPDDAIAFCLRAGGVSIGDVDAVAFAHRVGSDFVRGAADALKRMPLGTKRLVAQSWTDVARQQRQRSFLKRWRYEGRVVNVGHHEAHAASAFFSSGFDEAAVLTLDRGGDFVSTTTWHGRSHRLHLLQELRNPHSIGEIYTAVTAWLGFHPNADEGKVMGLASYGSDAYVPVFQDFVRLTPDGMFRVNLRWFRYHLEAGPLGRRFLAHFGPPRIPESEITEHHRDVAFGVQAVTERTALHVARALHELTGSGNLAVGGGVALNSAMNARLLTETPFQHIFIQPAAGDAGNALGAALYVWHQLLGRPREWSMEHAFLGPEYERGNLERLLVDRCVQFRRVADPAAEAADLLARGKILGWFQGRAEIGPRALGARSILADPRRREMKDLVNAEVKHREGFRPFAPSVLHERGPEYFAHYTRNPFMLLVLPVRNDKRDVIPAVTHVDGSGRMQSVGAESPLYRRLITEFERRTGVPVVLNTSFNIRGEPIVHLPEEALGDFLNTGLDALFLGDLMVEKERL